MPHDVEMRIETACIACVMLACLAVADWQFTLHRINREVAEREAAWLNTVAGEKKQTGPL